MITTIALLALLSGGGIGAQCELSPHSTPTKGFVLAVGNSAYPGNVLRTTESDACEVGKTFNALGYHVDLLFNANQSDLQQAITKLGQQAAGQVSPVLFYFAGHGFQINGVNYLLPVDAHFDNPTDIPNRTVSVDFIYKALKSSGGSKLVILDACRANPLAQNTPNDWIPGLAAPTNAPPGTLTAFATDPGSIAADGTGLHSPYTRSLLRYITKAGMTAEDVFKSVRDDVEANTDGQQTPWENTSLLQAFYFRDPIYVTVRITDGDDDVIVLINGQQVDEWNNNGSSPKRVQLMTGANDVVIKVYNQRSYTGGIPPFGHQPEGWRYATEIRDGRNQPLVQLRDGEDRPVDNGPRHGKLFTVATFQLLADDLGGGVTVANKDLAAWKH